MSHVPGGLSGALDADQFVGVPEGAVEEQDVAGIELAEKRAVDLGNCGHVGKALAGGGVDDEAEGGFEGRELRSAWRRNVGGKMRAQRKSTAAQAGVGSAGFEQREQSPGRELVPTDLTGNALQHGKHGIVFGQNAANGFGGVHAQGLEFAEQEQAEHMVEVAVQQDGSGDRRLADAGLAGDAARMELGRGFDLGAKVGRSPDEKPGTVVGADGDLGLGAGLAGERSGANRQTVGTGAIPLGKSAAGGRAEDDDAHEGSVAQVEL